MPQVKRALALGFFDGIHIGHAALIRRLAEVCSVTGLKPTVLTFDTLPQNLIEKKTIPLINSPEDRMGIILRYFDISDVIFLHFDKKMASMAWDEFFDYLVKSYAARHIVIGDNFRFGKGAEGTCKLLRHKCLESGFGCDIIPDVSLGGIVSSSTYIRQLLLAGDIERANAFLGHPHVFTATVEGGKKLGSKLGTPTLNMRFPPDVLIPAFGVYATKVYIPSQIDGLTGITNIGVRPTVDDGGHVTAETHIPDFQENLYGSKVRIEFHKYLRPEMKFESIDELKAQIRRDRNAAMEYFSGNS